VFSEYTNEYSNSSTQLKEYDQSFSDAHSNLPGYTAFSNASCQTTSYFNSCC